MNTKTSAKTLIVLLTYQSRIDWLKEAMHSVRVQYRPDWECIVADSSPDQAKAKEIEALTLQDGRFEYLHYPHHASADVAHKVNAATGEGAERFGYVVVMSDDDYLSPFFLERQVSLLEAHPKCGFAQGWISTFGSVGGLWNPQPGKCLGDQMGQNQFAGTCVMRMRQFREFGGYDLDSVPEGHPTGLEDYTLFAWFLKKGWNYGVVPEVLLFARQHGEQNNKRIYGTQKFVELHTVIRKKVGVTMVDANGHEIPELRFGTRVAFKWEQEHLLDLTQAAAGA